MYSILQAQPLPSLVDLRYQIHSLRLQGAAGSQKAAVVLFRAAWRLHCNGKVCRQCHSAFGERCVC